MRGEQLQLEVTLAAALILLVEILAVPRGVAAAAAATVAIPVACKSTLPPLVAPTYSYIIHTMPC